jgi:hypothetical protein
MTNRETIGITILNRFYTSFLLISPSKKSQTMGRNVILRPNDGRRFLCVHHLARRSQLASRRATF